MEASTIIKLNNFISKLQYYLGELGAKVYNSKRTYSLKSPEMRELREIKLILPYFTSNIIASYEDQKVLQYISFFTARYNLTDTPIINFPSYTTLITSDVSLRLSDLLDTSISSLVNNQFIKYNTLTNKWENVTLNTSYITENTNLFYTNERVDDRVAALLQDNSDISWTYDDVSNTLEANIVPDFALSSEVAALELSDLTDVGVTTPTNKNILIADGDSWESRPLVIADISDFGSYQTADSDLTTIAAANNGSILAATTASFLTAQETKLGYISVTQAVDLDTMESDLAGKQEQGNVLDQFITLGSPEGDGQFIVASGADTFAYESGATARASLDVYSTSQVDTALAGLGTRQTVRVATTANITIATALNNGDALDGITLVDGDLILVHLQTAAEENGVYVVDATPFRATSFDAYDEYPGALIAVQEGTINANKLYLCTSNTGGTINVDDLDFFQTAISGELLASNNLSDLLNVTTARTNLGVAIGTNVQAYDAGLQSISGLTTAANKMIYTTALDTYALTDLTVFARTLLDDADAATMRATLGISGVLPTAGNGLTDNSGVFDLGGSWDAPISLVNSENNNDAFTLSSTNVSSSTGTFALSGNDISLSVSDSGDNAEAFFFMNTSSIDITYDDGNGDATSLVLNGNNITVSSDQVGFIGVQYEADYSAANAANDRWLVDKGYVDGQIASIPTPTLQSVLTAGSVAAVSTYINISGDGIALDGDSLVQLTGDVVQLVGEIDINGQYSLPAVDGTSGQVITTDGAGVLSFTTISSGATSLAGLSDVVSATNTNRFVLVANGTTGYVGRALIEDDISDLGTYLTSVAFGDLTSTPTTLAGYGITDATSMSGSTSNGVLTYNSAGVASVESTMTYGSNILAFSNAATTIQSTATSTNVPLSFLGYITTDTGTNPVFDFRTILSPSSDVATRPLFRLRNGSTEMFSVAANGDWDYQGNNLTDVGTLSVTTLSFGGIGQITGVNEITPTTSDFIIGQDESDSNLLSRLSVAALFTLYNTNLFSGTTGNNKLVTSDGGTKLVYEDNLTFDGTDLTIGNFIIEGDTTTIRSNDTDILISGGTLGAHPVTIESTYITLNASNLVYSTDLVSTINKTYDLGDVTHKWQDLYLGKNIKIEEQASTSTPEAGDGHLWVKNTSPNTLWFTDDTDVSYQIGGGGIGAPSISAYTPTFTLNGSSTGLTVSTAIGNYINNNGVITYKGVLVVTWIGTGAGGALRIGLPSTAQSPNTADNSGQVLLDDAGLDTKPFYASIADTQDYLTIKDLHTAGSPTLIASDIGSSFSNLTITWCVTYLQQ